MKKKTYIIAAILVLVIGGIYYWRKKSSSTKIQTQYVTQTAERGTLTSSISASGSVVVDQQATIDPTITGTVADLTVKVGDHVEEEDFLFNIINDDLNASVAQSSASYQQSQNALSSAELGKKEAKADYDAAKKKDKKDGTSYTTEQLKVLKDKIDIAENGIIKAQKDLASSSISYQNTFRDAAKRKVTASISGTINEINIKNGDDLGNRSNSTTSSEPPIIIGDLGTLKAEVEVNEVDIANVSIGQKTMLTLDALPGLDFSGKVEKIDSLGTSASGVVSYKVTVSFDSLDEKIKPSMTVSASIITDAKQNVVVAPTSSVKSDGSSSYVEILVNGTLRKKNVTTGISNDTGTEILSGVSVGDEVVTQTIESSGSGASSSASSSKNRNSGGLSIPGMGGGSR